jgi:hypothetical protein
MDDLKQVSLLAKTINQSKILITHTQRKASKSSLIIRVTFLNHLYALILALTLTACGPDLLKNKQGVFPKEYYISPAFTAEEQESIHQGFKNWEPAISEALQTNFEFTFKGTITASVDPLDNIHLITFDNSVTNAILGRTHLLVDNPATDNVISGGDILIQDIDFITADEWQDPYNSEKYYKPCLESVMTHEIGHLVGLKHSQNYNDIMFEQAVNGCFKHLPTSNDVQALKSLIDSLKSKIQY